MDVYREHVSKPTAQFVNLRDFEELCKVQCNLFTLTYPWSSLKLHDVIKAGITRHGIHVVSTSRSSRTHLMKTERSKCRVPCRVIPALITS